MLMSFFFGNRKQRAIEILFHRPAHKERSTATLTIGSKIWADISESGRTDIKNRLKYDGQKKCQKFCQRKLRLTKDEALALTYYAGLYL